MLIREWDFEYRNTLLCLFHIVRIFLILFLISYTSYAIKNISKYIFFLLKNTLIKNKIYTNNYIFFNTI
jgi:hypothetical protein